MIRKKSLHSILIALLSVGLLLPGQIMGAVLCIRADGHITLEASNNGRCGFLAVSAAVSSPEQTAELSSRTDEHGPCIDVPLLTSADRDSGPFVSPVHALPKLEAPGLILVAYLLPVYAESPQKYCLLPPPSELNPLFALRTVVLLL